MAQIGNIISDLDLDGTGNGNGEDTAPAAGIISQYVKDLSVENPNAPHSFQWQDAPQIDIQFNIGAQAIDGEVHEVELKIVCSAKAQAGTTYVVDLSYCALVGMRNLEDGQAHAFLFAEAPRILFPFARRIVSDAVRDAGFPPLMLEPIDFNGLYVQQLAAQQQAAAEAAPSGNA
ncbi:protein-export chaperone SecB [Novosphingobium album (ex Liu et al. 2023)]|uniref:Protein-export protein SecB n=1 Tax=Novosphingobium album (ex Liu et al. 2023) TaxID=3031130 RepID=A0ABT5WVV3_9SPHN|nr:protein-export chaperone SecB [Novosphingobium album (ex Liu et al. 2023)]MDE8653987.1 protein-export chaperone SecB [Novosphingobium album (ex Liu et al. 2023)]